MQSNTKRDEEVDTTPRVCKEDVLFAICLSVGWLLALLTHGGSFSRFAATVTVLIGMVPLGKGAVRSCKQGIISMDVLMTIAVIGTASSGELLDAR